MVKKYVSKVPPYHGKDGFNGYDHGRPKDGINLITDESAAVGLVKLSKLYKGENTVSAFFKPAFFRPFDIKTAEKPTTLNFKTF